MGRGKFVDKVEEELDERLTGEHRRRYATDDEPTHDPDELGTEQRRETDEVGSVPALPVMTGPQRRGMLWGGAIGALIGAVIAAPFAVIPIGGQVFWIRLIIVMVAGAAGGATAGAVYFGARTPELSGESIDADNRPSSGSSLADPGTDTRGR